MFYISYLRSHETSDEDSECLSSSTAELVMENNVTSTIEHCSTKGFPPSSPHDLMNNNPSIKHKSFGSPIISNTSDLQNNELKNPVSSNTASNNECLESSSVPDADLTESLATATEALTEILVKSNIDHDHRSATQDTNGNEAPLLKQHPNVSSSSTQTESPPSSSFHSCCCKEWNYWKSAEDKQERCSSNSSVAVTTIQCQSTTNRCCHHRRKKATTSTTGSCSSSSETTQDNKINNCECTISKYSKNWRELRKTTSIKRANIICHFQSCNNNRHSKSV